MSKIALLVVIMPVLGFFFTSPAHAATLAGAKDTISNSRPSASAWLDANYASSDVTATITNNGSRFLASDSARIIHNDGTQLGSSLRVASQSADLSTVYFTGSSGTAAGRFADILLSPQTAIHTIQFTVVTPLSSGQKIIITFPGSGLNTASASASTFSFNGMTTSNPADVVFNNATCTGGGSISVTAPAITCTLGGAISANTVVTAIIGCTAQSSGVCTASAPRLINPTKPSTVGTSDSWTVNIQTTDSGGTVLDSAKVAVAPIETVRVSADVDPSLTFTIAGINSGNFSSQVASCNGTDAMTNVPGSTATEVSLGFLRNGIINLSGQKLTVATNGSQGYVISATSSGQFINPATGYWIKGLNGDGVLTANDTPAPNFFGSNPSEGFGVSACGTPALVNSSQWGATNCSTTFGSGCKYSNPWNNNLNSYYSTIASYTGGPVSATDANGQTIVKYAGSVTSTTPPGTYRTMFTYVATATF